MRTRVKICGITRVEDALHACDAGADAIGLVFYDKSPRNIDKELAVSISRAVPPFVSRVALFKDAEASFIELVLQSVEIDLIQFHGLETATFCEQFNRPYIKAIGLKGETDIAAKLRESEAAYASSRALLLDGHAPGEDGGSGEVVDWSRIQSTVRPFILAGGLNADNVARAVSLVRPYAVDVSSGVESAPGLKDADRISAFMRQVAEHPV